MSVLTRIKNNQIFDSTIWANAKIVPGSIVGSLFNSNLTMTSDVTITGNLTVQGASTYLTVASTNTYVNDPLIVLNNAFSGTNTYDLGFVFNRGSLQNVALIWNEFNKEFRLVGTTETGTTYGNINQSNFANLHIGNLTVDYATSIGSLTTTGFINTSGNISAAVGVFGSVNSTGFINTSANISAAIGLFGAINSTGYINTAGNISTAQLNAGQINTTGNVLASTVGASFLTASTAAVGNISAVTIGNTGAVVQGLTAQFDGNVIGGLAQFAALNSTPVGNATASTGTFTVLAANNNLWANASIATTAQGLGAIVVPNGGISVSGAANIAGAITTDGAAQFNNTVTVGGISSFTNTTNATDATGSTGALRIQGGASIAKDLWIGGNIYAANIFGVSEQLITVKDPLLYLEASNTYPYSYEIGVFSQFVGPNAQTGTGNAYQHTGLVRDHLDYTWKFFSNVVAEPTATIPFDSDTIFDPVRAGNLTLTYTQEATSATTGSFKTAGGAGVGGNIFHTGTQLQTSAANYIFATTPTTVDAFKAATTFNIGATSGTLTINNPTVVGTQTTQALYNTVTNTLNFARAANITMGHTDGTTTLQGNANIRAVTTTTTFTNGALVVAGGGGFADNVAIKQGHQLLIGSEIATSVILPDATAQFFSNVNNYSQINQQNVNPGDSASSDFIATANNGDDTQGYIDLGINSSTFANVLYDVVGPNDGYLFVHGNAVTGGGNLAIGTAKPNNDIIFFTGETLASYITMRINDNAGKNFGPNVHIMTPASWANSISGGSFVVDSGAKVKANLWVGNDLVVNFNQTPNNFKVLTTSSTAGLIYDTSYQTLTVNGGSFANNSSPVLGATFAVRSTDSMLIPVGSTAQRPSNTGNVDVTGMLRYNTSISNLEWYDGALWSVPGSAQTTVITDESFTGNGVQTTFTLANVSSTNSCIVSINGILQIPVTAYGITGTSLTFTEAPATGDAINVRKITTTASVTSIESSNGFMSFDVGDPSSIYANITGGTSAPTPRISTTADGLVSLVNDTKIVARGTAVNITANATPYALDSFTQSLYVTAKYIVSAKRDSTNFESYEALVTTDQSGNAYITTYGIVNNGTTMGVLSANVLAGNVQLYYTTNTGMTNANVRVYTTYVQ